MRIIYTEEQKQYIEKIVLGHSIHEAAQMVSEKFGFEMTDSMMHSYMKNHHLKNGLDHSMKRPCFKVFSKEVQEFIRTNVKGISNRELTEMVNKKFGTNYKVEQISSYKKNHNLKSNVGHSMKRQCNKIFSKETQEFIIANFEGIGNKELTEMVNKKFGTEYKTAQIISFKSRHKLNSGLNGRFQKGKKPFNHREVGSERINIDGYIEIKVAEPSIWKLKHVMVYEKTHGKVPDDCKVIFLDKNKLNLSIENLKLVTREELLEMNLNKLFFEGDPDRTETGSLIAKVTCTARKLNKK